MDEPDEIAQVLEAIAQDEPESEEPQQEESDEPSSESEAEPQPEEPTYTVKVDGQEAEVTLTELQSGYSRTQDYTHKTMALADRGRAYAVKEQELETLKSQYATKLQSIPDIPESEVDWLKMAEEDPNQYLIEKERHAQRKDADKTRHDELATLQQQELQRVMAQETANLRTAIPEFADPDKAQVLKTDMISYLKTKGFNEDEIGGIFDHRVIGVAMDAMKAKQVKKVAKKKAPKTLVPGAAAPKKEPSEKAKKSWDKARKTANLQDVANALKAELQI